MSEQLLPGYIIRRGSTLDRALLLKFMQRTYQDLFPNDDFSHLEQTVKQYFSSDTPLWWIEEEAWGQRGRGLEQKSLTRDGGAEEQFFPPIPSAPPSLHPPIACLWVGNAIDQVQSNRHAHIFILYVVPEHRRRGIGRALMQYVENWAIQRGDRQIGLQVFQSNKPALNLYNQLGYQTQSLWMVKFLSAEK
ncbi:MAG: GNAT family N-acetyltransferase [Nostoc sp.]|uniref:GNAT family N-acetyltransferase n=1 Tax=Nostoc sp. TaxID=1180 RepID=UPI002FF9A2FF